MTCVEPTCVSAPAALAAELGALLTPGTVLRRAEPLAKRTTLRVGGPADLYVEPTDETDLATVLRFCHDRDVPFFLLGRGSNLLIRDGGIRGVVIHLGAPAFSRIEFDADQLRCGAGAKLKDIALAAKRHGLGGLEFLEGIPGNLGGALRMNAGAMCGTTFGAVESLRFMNQQGQVSERPAREVPVEYRSCPLLKDHIALDAVFRCAFAPREEIVERMDAFSKKRWATQPAAPSAGCIFKNPAALPAGRVVDELGLKGLRVGGAVVSQEHGNFMINDGGATAKDMLQLIEKVKQHALRERGIALQVEVEIIGDGPEMPKLRELAAKFEIATRVHFPGWVAHDQLADRLHRSHVFGFPSVREFGGGVVLEAMAQGLVPVVLDYAGPAELVPPGTGFRVPMGPRADIIKGLDQCFQKLLTAPAEIPAIVRRAEQHVFDNFTWDAKARQMLDVYAWASAPGKVKKPNWGMPFGFPA